MNGALLQDRIFRGLGTAARAIGVLCDAYRPTGAADPLAPANRFLRLSAAFDAQDAQFRKAGLPGDPVWYGVFDAAYLRAGDYLVEAGPNGRSWFVAALQNLLPPLLVLTNTVVSVTRPGAGVRPGAGSYGGGGIAAAVITGFPASLLHSGSPHGAAAIPADARPSGATALLPPAPGVNFARGDMLRDALGRSFVVGLPELNALGWRLELRQAAS